MRRSVDKPQQQLPTVARTDLAFLFLCALALRLLYFNQYASNLPFLYGPIADSVAYLEQAFRVRNGDFGSPVLLAFSPLYGYFLALIRVDASLLIPVVVQLLLGCIALLLLYIFVSRNTGRRAALFSSALYLGYGTLLYYESKILSETIGLFLAVVAMGLFLGNGVRQGRIGVSVVAGVLFGLSVLARASLIFCVPFILLFAIVPWSRPAERLHALGGRALGIALGLALVFCTNGVWTKIHSGLFVPVILVSRTIETSSTRPYSGALADVAQGAEIISSYSVVEQARARLANTVDRDVKAEERSVLHAIDLKGWLMNLPSKLAKTVSNRESNFQYGYLGEKSLVPLLGWLPVSFGLILVWGLFGAVYLARREGVRSLFPYLALVLGVVATTTLYHPSSRYRLAVIIPLFFLAGTGFDALLRIRDTKAGKGAFVLVALLSIYYVQDNYRQRLSNRAEFELQLASSIAMSGDRAAAWQHAKNAARAAPHNRSIQQRVRLFMPSPERGNSSGVKPTNRNDGLTPE